MPITQLLSWYNLLFLIPLALAILYLAVYTFTGITFGDVDSDLHLELDADADADAHLEASTDADADHDLASDHDAPEQPSTSTLSDFLSLLGVGRVPLSLLVMIALLFWGVLGLIIDQALQTAIKTDWLIALIALPSTALLSLTLTGLIARSLARWLPTTETSAQRKSALVGRKGEAVYIIDRNFGLAAVRDRQGDMYQVPCRVADDKQPIDKGSRVVLYDYDEQKGIFYVAPFNA